MYLKADEYVCIYVSEIINLKAPKGELVDFILKRSIQILLFKTKEK